MTASDDYGVAWELISNSISQGLEASVPEGLRRVVEAVGELIDQPEDELALTFPRRVSQRDIAAHMGLDTRLVSRNTDCAIEMDLLVDDNPEQGGSGEIRLGGQSLPSGFVLPARNDIELSI